ncbi:MAG: amino acid adenylation domain-containing protein, partial [Verrucomicrobia bacterium]|nr:amino acid adenylation domain-containing protein [Verrucomicrobiota bacterium]
MRVNLFVWGENEHVLLPCVHHIVWDGWSGGVFEVELHKYYNAFCTNEKISLNPLPMQYAEYAVRQKKKFQGEALENQLAFWRNQLKNPSILELPADRPRPKQLTYTGAKYSFLISSALSTRLRAFISAEKATPFMALLACFQAVLSRYSGQKDILVGIPFANRQEQDLEELLGYFVNTLVMRTDLSAEPGFGDLLKKVRNVSLDAFQHHELPFEKLVQEINPARDLSRHPLFQVMFVLQNADAGPPAFKGLEVSRFDINKPTTHFDLSLALSPNGDAWSGIISYNTDLYDPDSIERFSNHYITLLDGMLANPDHPVSKIPLLTLEEQQQFLEEWNNRPEDCPEDLCIHELFEEQTRKTPDSIAVVFEDQELSYSELDLRVKQLATHLKSLGVGPEVLVGICIERSIEMLVGLLAILKAGGAYVPLDPHYPVSRLDLILEDADVHLLVTQRSLADLCASCKGEVLYLDEWIGDSVELESLPSVSSDSSAYIIYTSGSTGQPKGTVIEHRSAVNMLNSVRYRPGLVAEDVFLAVATISFDISVFELFAPLSVGARLVIMPDSMRADGHQLVRLLKSCQATIVHGTPSMWKLLLYAGWTGDQKIKALAGGEVLTPDIVDQILPRCRELWNLYGPTETTVYSLITRIHNSDNISIGKPVGNTEVYIVDEHDQLVPVGVPGELLIGGRGLAREYLNRPELTGDRFIPSPFSSVAGSRLYRSGDLCRWRSDGRIEYVGRMDNQVKIRGFRVELGEIEVVTAQHPKVRECAAKVWNKEGDDKQIVAYVIPEDSDESPDTAELFEFLRQRVPDYMVPAAFVFLDSFPQTANAKIDRKALPKPELNQIQGIDGAGHARSPTEKDLVRIWSKVLGIKSPNIHTSFFDLGGHSLLAFQVVSMIRDSMGVEISIKQFFDFPIIVELAELIAPGRDAAGTNSLTDKPEVLVEEDISPVSEAVPESESRTYPVSYAQYRLWFLEQLDDQLVAYNMPFARRLRGKFDVEAFRRVLETLVKRHEPYRTLFKSIDGEPMQVIQPPVPFEMPVVDLCHLDENAQGLEVTRRVTAEASKPFDLEHDLMIRSSVLKLAEDHFVLLLTEHHIASDGWSHQILWREIEALYTAYQAGKELHLPELPMQYAEFSTRQREQLKGVYWMRLLNYWKNELSGVTPLKLPTDRQRPAKLSSRGGIEGLQLDEGLVKRLRRLSVSQGMTLLMTLLSGFQVLLSRLSGQKDVVVGMPTASRNSSEEEQIIGLFVNTVLIRTDLSDDPTFGQLLNRIKNKSLEALEHQEMPFELLVDELHPERDLSRNPLFQVLVNMQEELAGGSAIFADLQVSNISHEIAHSKFDLTLYISVKEKIVNLRIIYSADLFNAERIEVMLKQFALLLEQVVNDPNVPVSAISLVTEDQVPHV